MSHDVPEPAPPAQASRSEGRELTSAMRWLLVIFAGLALMAGVLLFVLSEETDRWFSWTIAPPLTAAFLGASYWAACVLFSWSASQRRFELARAALPPALVIAVLLLVATLVHLDKFHLEDVFGWFWLTAYVIVPPALALLVVDQLRRPNGQTGAGPPLPRALRAILAGQGAVVVVVGAALFVAPTAADSLWPWTLTPLTARAIGAFVLGFGIAAAHASWEGDAQRFRGAALAYVALGALQLVAVARYWGDLGEIGVNAVVYLAFLVIALALGVAGILAGRAKPARSP